MTPPEPLAPKLARLADLGRVFFRIGNFTFGGGSATVAALQREMVTRRGWLDKTQFALCYALSRITPGTNLLAFCTGTGWLLRGWRGALIGVLAASIPSCLIVWLVTAGFDTWSTNPIVRVGIDGALAASVGILLASFWQLIRPYLARQNAVQNIAIIAGSILLSLAFRMSPISIFVLAAVVGFYWKDGES